MNALLNALFVSGKMRARESKLRFLLLLIGFIYFAPVEAQTIYDANGGRLCFLAARKTHKVGTDGSAAGNVTLYTNVITIGGQAIDCIVRTVTLSNCTFTLPSGATAGTIPFDYSAPTAGSTLSGNNDSFFAPTMKFTAAGYVEFKFEFILGGSYNNTTNTGTSVSLQNIYVNSYDIDGSSSSYQFTEFGGFIQSTLGTGANINTTFNSSSYLTKFQSTVTTNQVNITGDAHRIRVKYEYLSYFTISLGQTGSGAAYYFLDFGPGATWSGSTSTTTVVSLDLDTDSAGFNHNKTRINSDQRMTRGATNITNSTNAITSVIISYDSSLIKDGNNEAFIIKKGSATDTFKLKFTSGGTQNFTHNSLSFTCTKSFLSGGISKMEFSKNGGGTFTTSEIEGFIDSLHYHNRTNSNGLRTFSCSIRESVYTSNVADFNLTIDNTTLPVELLYLQAKAADNHHVEISWATATEIDNSHFVVERLSNATNTWESIGQLNGFGNSQHVIHYSFIDNDATDINPLYRLVQYDFNGKSEIFGPVQPERKKNNTFKISPNPFNETIELNGNLNQFSKIEIMDNLGNVIIEVEIPRNSNQYMLNLSELKSGFYFLKGYSADQITIKKIQKI